MLTLSPKSKNKKIKRKEIEKEVKSTVFNSDIEVKIYRLILIPSSIYRIYYVAVVTLLNSLM